MHTYQKNTNLFGNAQNVLFNFILREWSFFYSDIGCSESKVIFKWLKTTTTTTTKTKTKKKALQGENICTSCISFSLSENSHKTRLEAAIRERRRLRRPFFRPEDQHWHHVVSSPFARQRFREFFGNYLISCRAGAWHYQISPDFLNSGLKMASKIEGKAKVIACSWNDIKGQITPES